MIISYLLILLVIIIDIVTKQTFSSIYAVGEVEVIFDNILVFGYVQNRGASFGMLEGAQFIFFIVTIFALSLFGYLFTKSNIKTKKVYTISLILLISGTLGNAIDRLFYGYVIDFIRVPFLPFVGNTFFNIADTALNVGIGLMVVDVIFFEGKREKNVDKSKESDHTNES